MKSVNIGIIGCGSIAFSSHMPLLKAHPNINLIGFQNRTKEKALLAKEQFGAVGSKVYDEASDLLEDERIDAVYILTSNDTHASYAIAALNAKKHVMVEKPMGRNKEEVHEMLKAANNNNKLLSVTYQNRFRAEVQTLKSMIDNGDLGEIYAIKAKAIRRRGTPSWGSFTNKTIQGGGPLIDVGSHVLDLALYSIDFPSIRYVSGSSYQKLSEMKTANRFGPFDSSKYDVEDSAFAFIKTTNNITLYLEASYALNTEDEGENIIEVFGTKAGAKIDNDLRLNYVTKDGYYGKTVALDKPNPTKRLTNDWVQAITKNQAPLIKASEAALVNEIIDAVYESQDKNQSIILKD